MLCPYVPGKVLYVGTSLGLVILVLIVVLLIFFRHRRISRGSKTCGMTIKAVMYVSRCRLNKI